MDERLSVAQIKALMHEYLDIALDRLTDDEVFARLTTLFNRIYAMGQAQERIRRMSATVSEPQEKRGQAE